MDEDVKSIFLSKGFWGSVVTLVAAALSFAHYTVTPADQATIVDLIVAVLGAIGGLIAIYGRVVATKKIAV